MTTYTVPKPFNIKPLLINLLVASALLGTMNACPEERDPDGDAKADSDGYWERNREGYGSDGYGDDERML